MGVSEQYIKDYHGRENELLKEIQQLKQEILDLKNRLSKLGDCEKDKKAAIEEIERTRFYRKFHSSVGWCPTTEDWNNLFHLVELSDSSFVIALQKLVYLNDVEKKICYLCRIGVRPMVIADLLCLSNISIYRKRLYEKLTGERGSAKRFEKYITSL